MRMFAVVMIVAACSSPRAQATLPSTTQDPPETVLATYRAKPGKEAELDRIIAEHWAALRSRDLVLATPHLRFRTEDEPGKTTFLDIFTWRRESIPDDAPAEIQAIWARMALLVEARGGHPGIEFPKLQAIETR